MLTKLCTNKNCTHPLKLKIEFYNNERYPDGKDCWCKDCRKREAKNIRIKDPVKYLEYQKNYRETVLKPIKKRFKI